VPRNPNPSANVGRGDLMFVFVRCLSGFGYGISFRFGLGLEFVNSPFTTTRHLETYIPLLILPR
ncbi:unnamed protein product, partial [Prunus brigantina]